ncbi:hypothetical protein JZ751_013627 [Albula glossodonta]|uniref:Uncharacterized protein n=1 Tax=Albula glossodonta TaxID=121402 RepID=A0A8T2NWJ7_9TELE|nr:hypothetical protein JZ751_013627 [Albula glossodonta]
MDREQGGRSEGTREGGMGSKDSNGEEDTVTAECSCAEREERRAQEREQGERSLLELQQRLDREKQLVQQRSEALQRLKNEGTKENLFIEREIEQMRKQWSAERSKWEAERATLNAEKCMLRDHLMNEMEEIGMQWNIERELWEAERERFQQTMDELVQDWTDEREAMEEERTADRHMFNAEQKRMEDEWRRERDELKNRLKYLQTVLNNRALLQVMQREFQEEERGKETVGTQNMEEMSGKESTLTETVERATVSATGLTKVNRGQAAAEKDGEKDSQKKKKWGLFESLRHWKKQGSKKGESEEGQKAASSPLEEVGKESKKKEKKEKSSFAVKEKDRDGEPEAEKEIEKENKKLSKRKFWSLLRRKKQT